MKAPDHDLAPTSDAAYRAFAAQAFAGPAPVTLAPDVAPHAARLALEHFARAARCRAEGERLALLAEEDLRNVARRFAPALAAHVDANAPEGRRSLQSPAGTIGRRKCPGGAIVVDAKAAADWIASQATPDAFRRWVQVPNERAIEEFAARTGVVPPGCRRMPERDAVYVRQGDVYVNLTDEAAR